MKQNRKLLLIVPLLLVIGVLVATKSILANTTASNDHSLYSYDLGNATTTVASRSLTNGGLPMNLYGAWTTSADGTRFSGNTTSSRSVAYARPASDNTLSVGTNEAVGASIVFSPENLCHSDSQNVTQIGFFKPGATQVKLQLSKCASGSTYPECRIAGSKTPATSAAGVKRLSLRLQAGQKYRFDCVKSPDSGSGATLTMRITLLSTSTTSTKSFSIPATGPMVTREYVSVAAKYPMGQIRYNTDQYTGKVSKVAYCQAMDVTSVQTCLDEETAL